MDEETISKAKLISAVICRIVDYHARTQWAISAPKGTSQINIDEIIADGEKRVAVALENMIDGGALE